MKRPEYMSRLFAPTLKEDPAEAELASHKLLLRAGMIRKVASGLYSYLPLAWRSIKKIEAIIRDEMEAIGAQDMMVPILTPAELWESSGRLGVYGPELMRLEDRHERPFCLGPTHEETFTDLITNELRSYKQLPVTLYQIQDKFRDEMRPRFGLMRGREFIMKDAYSFSADKASLVACYQEQKAAYMRIAKRAGIYALPVVADSGQIGGDTSVEFMALADAGEAEIVYCDCGFAANVEAAVAPIKVLEGPAGELTSVKTPNVTTMSALAEALSLDIRQTRKSLALITEDGSPVVCFLPGDHDMNEVKAEKLFGNYHLMSDEELSEYGLVKGFIGPIGLSKKIRLVGDSNLQNTNWWVVGANSTDYHSVNVQLGRDFEIDEWADLCTVCEGDPCPVCEKPLKAARGIEISQVFQLGTKYSEAMGATFSDKDGKERPFEMGCYGIGVSRMLAAAVEQHNDEHGIIWPISIAPYHVEVILLAHQDEELDAAAKRICDDLSAADVEVLVDERKERPGVKFADADLVGLPYQVILGKRGLQAGIAELKARNTGEKHEIPLDTLAEELAAWVHRDLNELAESVKNHS